MPDSAALRWARLFEDHAAALLAFAASLGLDGPQAEIATGQVLRYHAARVGALGTAGDERRLLQTALMTEVARAEHRLRTAGRRRADAAVRAAGPRLVPSPSTSPARPA